MPQIYYAEFLYANGEMFFEAELLEQFGNTVEHCLSQSIRLMMKNLKF